MVYKGIKIFAFGTNLYYLILKRNIRVCFFFNTIKLVIEYQSFVYCIASVVHKANSFVKLRWVHQIVLFLFPISFEKCFWIQQRAAHNEVCFVEPVLILFIWSRFYMKERVYILLSYHKYRKRRWRQRWWRAAEMLRVIPILGNTIRSLFNIRFSISMLNIPIYNLAVFPF